MELIFIRHGHGEHLNDYPNQLNMMHPGLTELGKMQVTKLRTQLSFNSDDIILVSPTRRTIETALMLADNHNIIVTPLIGPRMFPQNPEFPFLKCDYIYSKQEIRYEYNNLTILDFDLNCWNEGINRIDEDLFKAFGNQLIGWMKQNNTRHFIISHDGSITNYRILFGEAGLTRSDFLGEAGVYKMTI